MFTKQNTKQKVYKHVMFIKQNKKCTGKLCLQNKSLQTHYIYKTKMYRQVMFTKQDNTKRKVYKHVIFIKQKFTDKLCLQNITKQTNVYKTKVLQTRYVYKTK